MAEFPSNHGNDDHGAAVADTFTQQDSGEYRSGQGGSLRDNEIEGALDQALGGHSHDAPVSSGNSIANSGYTQNDGREGKADVLTGDDGNDFISAGQKRIEFAGSGSGGTEFPFATDSLGETQIEGVSENGRLRIDGEFRNFEGVPLFEADGVGERADPTATIRSGDEPQDLIDRFREGAESQGFEPTGAHLHFSPSDEADATIVRTLSVTQTSATSGKISGDFALTPEEQAAVSANRGDDDGLFYVNIHTNRDLDGDGEGGELNGEARVQANPTNLG